tara:strand:+ start:72 stop:848 length:777 start_codon:yes stop_codon:yes gene_type:complete
MYDTEYTIMKVLVITIINFTKILLNKISRVIFSITPNEFYFKEHTYHGITSHLKKKIVENLVNETFENFKEHFKKSLIIETENNIREYAIKTSLLNDKNVENYYLEFGVYTGGSTNLFSKYVKKFYAFDSFEGLKEDWVGEALPKGHFNLNKKIPKLNSNVEPIVGWVEDTLEDFLKQHNPKINFVHFDMDTYSPTKFTLKRIKPYLAKDAIIIFDEFYNFFGWEHGEYKAFNEVFKKEEFEYKAFRINGTICVIQIK